LGFVVDASGGGFARYVDVEGAAEGGRMKMLCSGGKERAVMWKNQGRGDEYEEQNFN